MLGLVLFAGDYSLSIVLTLAQGTKSEES